MIAIREDSGQTLVVVILCMGLLLGFMAVALDMGQLLYAKRRMQTVADAAAAAAALEIQQCAGTSYCTAMQTAVASAMAENGLSGYTARSQCSGAAGNGFTVEINNGPCFLGASDPNNGNVNYVEAVVVMPKHTFFGGFLGASSVSLGARSEAGLTNSPNCVFVSANNWTSGAGQTMTMNGGTFNANCGIVNDSGGSPALIENSGAQLTATSVSVHGTTLHNGGSDTPSHDRAAALPDPLAWLQSLQPSVGTCTSVGPYSGTGNTLGPGTYCGININTNGSLTLTGGTYNFNGYVNINSGASLTGHGVTLYFASGTLQPNSTATVDLSAPTTGNLAGILLWQSTSNSSGVTIDDANSTLQGAIYLPNSTLTLNSGSHSTAYSILDVKGLIVDSGATFTINSDYSSLPGGSPVKVVRLLE